MRTLLCTTVLLVSGAAPLVGCSHAQPPMTATATTAASQPTRVTWKQRQATSIPAYNAGANYMVVFYPKFTRE
jgi:hypothetical protein